MFGHRAGIAVDEVQNACGDARIDEALDQHLRRGRGVLGRFEDRGAACGKGAGDLLAGQVHREVPRGQQHARADRLMRHDLRDQLVAAGRDQAPAPALRFLAEKVGDIGQSGDLAHRLRMRLAHFGGDDAGDGRRTFAQEIGGAAQDGVTLRPRGAAPCGKGIIGSLQRSIELGGAGLGAVPDDFACRRVDHRHFPRIPRGDPRAVDEHLEGRVGSHRACSLGCSRRESTLRELEILLRIL